MTDIYICGIHELGARITFFKPDLIISISDPGRLVPALATAHAAGIKVLPLSFHDAPKAIPMATAPSKADADRIRNCLAEFPSAPARILVHCHYGLSRSPAVALLTLAILAETEDALDGHAADTIIEQVFQAAPDGLPDARVIAIADRLSGTQRQLFRSRLDKRLGNSA